jgi:hypothetical protein
MPPSSSPVTAAVPIVTSGPPGRPAPAAEATGGGASPSHAAPAGPSAVVASLIEAPRRPNTSAPPSRPTPAPADAPHVASPTPHSPKATGRSAAVGAPRELPYNPAELCEAAGISAAQLAELQEYGIITARGSGADTSFRPESVEIARIAGQLLSQGIDGRHLRAWRQAAERESALFEQRIMPLMRQRNPQARAAALSSLSELSALGARLHDALVDAMLQHHFDGS